MDLDFDSSLRSKGRSWHISALTNRLMSADEAIEWSLASRVTTDVDLASDAEAEARKLAGGST